MITFKDVIETKNNLKDANALKNRLEQTNSSYSEQTHMNNKLMQNLNVLIGKYFTEPRKAYAHEYIDAMGKTTATLQISKAGIGKTPQWGSNINPFGSLLENDTSYYHSKGFIGEIIANKEIYDKVYSHLSKNGQYILQAVNETYEKHKIENPEEFNIYTKISLNNYEQALFKTDIVYIHICDDGNTPTVKIRKDKESKSSWDDHGVIYELNDIHIDKEEDYLFMLFTNYHAKELNDALDNYIEQTKERTAIWNNFNDELKQKLAKFLILMEI